MSSQKASPSSLPRSRQSSSPPTNRLSSSQRSSTSNNNPGSGTSSAGGRSIPNGKGSSQPQRRGYGQSSMASQRQAEGTDNEYNELVDQIETVKENSVSSSRNALRMLRETEDVSADTLGKLQGQNEKLTKIENRTTKADLEASKVDQKSTELKKLNKNFLVAKFGFSNPFSSAKREAKRLQKEVDAIKQKEEKEEEVQRQKEEREAASGGVASGGGAAPAAEDQSSRASRGTRGGSTRANRLEHEKDCALEDEIDDNLDQISESLARIKGMGLTMNQSIENSTAQIGRITERTDRVNDKVKRTERRINKITN